MYMLDTDICIYTIKKKPVSVLHRLQKMRPGDLCMSVITYAELQNGARKSAKVEHNLGNIRQLAGLVTILDFDCGAADRYGEIRSGLESQGRPIGTNDLLIAAHALSCDKVLVTNNERGFSRVEGLKIENWAG